MYIDYFLSVLFYFHCFQRHYPDDEYLQQEETRSHSNRSPLSGGEEHDRNDDSDTGSSSSNPERLPTSKKQRLLQSVREHSPEIRRNLPEVDPADLMAENNNTTKTSNGLHHSINHLTNPYNHLYNHQQPRKSMDNVLKRLNSKVESSDHHHQIKPEPQNGTSGRDGEMDGTLLDSISSVIEGTESVEAKERRLSDMITQLQSIKESLVQYKHPKVRANASHLDSWCLIVTYSNDMHQNVLICVLCILY